MSKNIVPILRGRPKDAGKHEDILEAARNLFLQRGFHGTSMDALAKRANVSKATLYSHFEDKEALYRALIEDKLAAYEVSDLSRRMTWDMEDDLTYIARHMLDLIFSDEALEMQRMVISEVREGSDVPRLFIETGPRRVLGQIASYFDGQKKRGIGYLDDVHEDAELFSALVVGHAPLIFALAGVDAPLDVKQRHKRARRAVTQFIALKQMP